jgi:two-component system, OmpR family, clock-associated histidine kinase SasA
MSSEAILQLLLFVDKRPNSNAKIRQIRDHLKELRADYVFDLQIVDVGEQPHLAEHFKLVATPTLIKLHPEPRQTLAGSNLVEQVKTWWGRWQQAVEEYQSGLYQDVEVPQEAIDNTTIRSITHSAELMRLSDEIFRLKQEKEALQEQVRFKDRLIAMLAHDLRNPLTATSIALETMEFGVDQKHNKQVASRLTPEMMSQLLKHARTQTKAIDRMITDILQAARGTGVEIQIYPRKLDLGELCLEVLQQLKNQFHIKTQVVNTDIPSDLPSVYADPERVRQVLANLLDNAAKYTPEHGEIQLSILHRTTQKVQVSICDTGPGIPKENQERIFEDRFRLERDVAQDGYGIGLSLCQRIVQAHYGQIWVDSVPNHGSCFNFTLPVYRP